MNSRASRIQANLLLACLAATTAMAQTPPEHGPHTGHTSPSPASVPEAIPEPMPEPMPEQPLPQEHRGHGETPPAETMPDMPGMPAEKPQDATGSPKKTTSTPKHEMEMGSMRGGKAPADARNSDDYAEGYGRTGMPGMETSDQIAYGWLALDELEYLSGNEGDGFAWNMQGNYGDDQNKLWVRSQGLKVPDELDPTTSGEVLWWRPYSAYWGTQLGVRQDFGEGAHTYLAFGVEGLAPYWFLLEATGYVAEDGRLAARFKLSYDIRWTNRLIMTPNLEANAYSKAEEERNLGSGLGNVELGLRVRYEFHRKFAPYAGYVWERSFSGTADMRRADGDPVNEHRFVAGFRVWF